jgi:3-oxoisoapionate kinase
MIKPKLTFFADDFTGATDALDALARASAKARLFIEPPRPRDLEAVGGYDAIGVAGNTRTLPEAQLREQLHAAFRSLASLGAPLCHYKVCSTFDSSATIGSIGAAIEEGLAAFGGEWIPLIVGVPALGRWCVFGNLFARAGTDGAIARLDRHPVSRHPTTPMHEADLLSHLALQTTLSSGLVVTHLADPRTAREKAAALEGVVVRLFDVADGADLRDAARAIALASERREVRFVVGSSAVEYALGASWREQGSMGPMPEEAKPTERVLVLSGSCSSISSAQIHHAVQHGFVNVPLDLSSLDDPRGVAATRVRMLSALKAGSSVVIYSALGRRDPRLSTRPDLQLAVGPRLAELASTAITDTQIERIIVVGGDTSSACARTLGIRSVDVAATFIAGAPVCRAHAPGSAADGAEIVFKGGSLGPTDVFELAVSTPNHRRPQTLSTPWPHM